MKTKEKPLGKKVVLNCLKEMRKHAMQKQVDRQQAGEKPVVKTDLYIKALSEAINMINDMSYTGSLVPPGEGQQTLLELPEEPKVIQHPSSVSDFHYPEKRFKNPV